MRPGSLSEDHSRSEREGVVYCGPNQQESSSLPCRLVARVCLEALATPAASRRIIEITSSPNQQPQALNQWLEAAIPVLG